MTIPMWLLEVVLYAAIAAVLAPAVALLGVVGYYSRDLWPLFAAIWRDRLRRRFHRTATPAVVILLVPAWWVLVALVLGALLPAVAASIRDHVQQRRIARAKQLWLRRTGGVV